MNFYLYNQGTCTRLKLVGEELKELLIKNGWQNVSKDQSEIIFINSCSFLKTKEDEFLKLISKINSVKKENQKIAVFGCLPAVSAKKITDISANILLFNRNLKGVSDYFNLKSKLITINFTNNDKLKFRQKLILKINDIFLKDDGIKFRLKKDQIYHLKISDGCRGNCSYCSEKFTTEFKSRKIAQILESFKKGLAAGYKLFALNSDDTSTFGWDNGENVYQLLEKMISIRGDFKIAISEFNPRGLFDPRIKKILQSDKIIYITIPIQSGSQKILNLMRRPYQIDDVKRKILEIKKNNKKLKINTHIIVGFPGETENDFRQTLNLFDWRIIDRVKIFAYSDRPGTEASKMSKKVSAKDVKIRVSRLQRKILMANMAQLSLSNWLLNLKTLE